MLYWAVGLAALLAFSLAWADSFVAHHVSLEGLPGDLKKMIGLFEIFGHGTGVVVVLLLLWTLDRANAFGAVVVASSAWGAGLLVICVKPFVERIRPSQLSHDFVAAGDVDRFASQLQYNIAGDVVDPGFFHDAVHAFPSGHTAVAFGMAWTLGRLYPAGRFLFLGFAAMVAVQRVCAQAHFVSDTIAGAGIGMLVGTLVLRSYENFDVRYNPGNAICAGDCAVYPGNEDLDAGK